MRGGGGVERGGGRVGGGNWLWRLAERSRGLSALSLFFFLEPLLFKRMCVLLLPDTRGAQFKNGAK